MINYFLTPAGSNETAKIDSVQKNCWIDLTSPTPAEIERVVEETKIDSDLITILRIGLQGVAMGIEAQCFGGVAVIEGESNDLAFLGIQTISRTVVTPYLSGEWGAVYIHFLFLEFGLA